ncbi:hypothetical protein [Rhizobium leguminosarum]|uniref:Uncharacterized protein n=1 Tax=Rhizobium leguminosarum TaxID=384 RepID=A0A2Z4YS68_RHILE|nr:hypothetical protein [Rhizobium leguminosarum]AXA44317.1 hypothetical protein DLJ82_6346 [Rhizobium leguminosarum]
MVLAWIDSRQHHLKAIDRLYLEVEAAVPMVMEDNLVKVVLRYG